MHCPLISSVSQFYSISPFYVIYVIFHIFLNITNLYYFGLFHLKVWVGADRKVFEKAGECFPKAKEGEGGRTVFS